MKRFPCDAGPTPPAHRRRPSAVTLIAAVAALCVVAAACSDSDDGDDGSAPATPSTAEDTTRPTGDGPLPQDPSEDPAPAPDLGVPVVLVDLELGLQDPIGADVVPGSSSVIVAERRGSLHEVVVGGNSAELVDGPLLDLGDRVGSTASERGLLGVAVTADADALVVSYTAAEGGANQLERYDLSGTPGALAVDPSSRRSLLRVDQPYGNHNGGHVTVGPDDMLYVGIGDGGSGGDPEGNGQDPTTLLGKVLRIDPDGGAPPDNPFADSPDGARPEIWLTGVRNPWRFSFDVGTGDLWIADVGQNAWEEVNRLPAADGAGRGANLGWDLFEGREPFDDADPAAAPWSDGPFVEPIHTYGRDQGCSVTGGQVYRGSAIQELRGAYLFADYCGSGVRALDPADPDGSATELGGTGLEQIVSFARGPGDEILVISLDRGVFLLDRG